MSQILKGEQKCGVAFRKKTPRPLFNISLNLFTKLNILNRFSSEQSEDPCYVEIMLQCGTIKTDTGSLIQKDLFGEKVCTDHTCSQMINSTGNVYSDLFQRVPLPQFFLPRGY